MFKKFKRKNLIKTYVLEKKDNKFLLKRTYKHSVISEYIVCENYDFKSNTYKTGVRIFDISQAYIIFNDYVINNLLPNNQKQEVVDDNYVIDQDDN